MVLEIGDREVLQHRNLVQQEPRRHIVVNELQIVNVPRSETFPQKPTPCRCTWEKTPANRSVRCVRQREE